MFVKRENRRARSRASLRERWRRGIFTDGRAVYRSGIDAKPEKLLEYFPIEKIVALG
jgi:hypothetical protein